VIIDLSHTLENGIPYPPVCFEPKIETIQDNRQDGTKLNLQQISIPSHIGTHIDAFRHLVSDGETIDNASLEQFMGEGVVIDVTKSEPETITVEDIKNSIKSNEIQVKADDIVILYTSWCEKFNSNEEYLEHPWLTKNAAKWLANCDIKMIGMDLIAPEYPNPYRSDDWDEKETWPIHNIFLRNEIYIAENLTNLKQVSNERLDFIAFPLKIRNGDGSLVRFVGIK